MATYYVRTDGNNANTGTSDSAGGAWLTIEYALTHAAAGDTVYIRASAGNASSNPTSSLDYTLSTYTTPTNGSSGAGYIKFIGYNGMPTIGTQGLAFYSCVYNWFENLYLVALANSFGINGLINCSNNCVVKSCRINCNLQAGTSGINATVYGNDISGNIIYGGSTSPTPSSSADGIYTSSYGNQVCGNIISYMRGNGISVTTAGGGALVLNNLVYLCAGNGIETANLGTDISNIFNNTIDNNKGHGVSITGTGGYAWNCLRNNNITNHTQASKYGITASDGSTALNDQRQVNGGYNNVWNNTGNYNNVSANATDFSVDPGYTDATNGDFTFSNSALKGTAYPPYLDVGGVQLQATSSSGGGVFLNSIRGGFVN